jgi:hypothetical protein
MTEPHLHRTPTFVGLSTRNQSWSQKKSCKFSGGNAAAITDPSAATRRWKATTDHTDSTDKKVDEDWQIALHPPHGFTPAPMAE